MPWWKKNFVYKVNYKIINGLRIVQRSGKSLKARVRQLKLQNKLSFFRGKKYEEKIKKDEFKSDKNNITVNQLTLEILKISESKDISPQKPQIVEREVSQSITQASLPLTNDKDDKEEKEEKETEIIEESEETYSNGNNYSDSSCEDYNLSHIKTIFTSLSQKIAKKH